MPASETGTDSGSDTDRGGLTREHAAAGQAALMLVESLMLALVERGTVPAMELIEAVETVIDTKRRLAEEGHEPEVGTQAVAMLTTIANSLAAAGPPGTR